MKVLPPKFKVALGFIWIGSSILMVGTFSELLQLKLEPQINFAVVGSAFCLIGVAHILVNTFKWNRKSRAPKA